MNEIVRDASRQASRKKKAPLTNEEGAQGRLREKGEKVGHRRGEKEKNLGPVLTVRNHGRGMAGIARQGPTGLEKKPHIGEVRIR